MPAARDLVVALWRGVIEETMNQFGQMWLSCWTLFFFISASYR
jgi:hypothetical protein